MKVTVVLPAYNEVDNVAELTERLDTAFKKLKIKNDILYVIQGKDGTHEVLKKLKKKYKQLRLMHYPEPLGVGPAFIIGFNNIAKECTHVLTLDADLNHHPEELHRFFTAMKKEQCDIVIGSRKVKGGEMKNMPWYKKTISGGTNILLRSMFGLRAKDITSGYRLFRREVIEYVRDRITSRNFEFYPEVILWSQKKGFSMTEVPITFTFRIHGESKLNFFTSGIGYVKLLGRIMSKQIKE